MTGSWEKPPEGVWININIPSEVIYVKTSLKKSRIALLFDGSSYKYFSINNKAMAATFDLGNCAFTVDQELLFDSSHSSNLLSYTDKEWAIARKLDRLIIGCNGVKLKEIVYMSAGGYADAGKNCHDRYGLSASSSRTFQFNNDQSDYFYIGQPYPGIVRHVH